MPDSSNAQHFYSRLLSLDWWEQTFSSPGELIEVVTFIAALLSAVAFRKKLAQVGALSWLKFQHWHLRYGNWFASAILAVSAASLWILYAILVKTSHGTDSPFAIMGVAAFSSLLFVTLLQQYLHTVQPGREYIKQLIEDALDLQRRTRYADALPSIHTVVDHLRNTRLALVDGSVSDDHLEQFRKELQTILRFVADAFSITTGKPCRASIKMLVPEWQSSGRREPMEAFAARHSFYTLARDAGSRHGNRVPRGRLLRIDT